MQIQLSRDMRNIAALACHTLAAAGLIFLSDSLINSLSADRSFLSSAFVFLGGLALAIFAATRLRALQNMMHECAHHSLFKRKKWNTLTGHIIGALLLRSFSKYSLDHISHHRFLGDPLRDLDLARFGEDFRINAPSNLKSCRATLFLSMAAQINQIIKSLSMQLWHKKDPIWVSSIRILIFTCLALILFSSGFSWSLKISIVSTFLAYSLICVWSDFADHWVQGPDASPSKDQFHLSRNHLFRLNLMNLIFQPRNDGYHLVHHIFPSAPTDQLEQLHKTLLATEPKYSALSHYFEEPIATMILKSNHGHSR